MKRIWVVLAFVIFTSGWLLTGCASNEEEPGSTDNPFLQDQSSDGKEDTAYMNPDGIEVEVDLEGDVEASGFRILDGPAELGQYALTYLRNRGQIYLESLAEDASSDKRSEWLVNGEWVTANSVNTSTDNLRHFRLRGVNAVLLFKASEGAKVGQVFTAEVPIKPFSTMSDLGKTCADPDSHMSLSQSIYWYLWNPDRPECNAETQQLKITISKMMPKPKPVYPEFDRLVKDGKVTVVILFGQIDDERPIDKDPGMINMTRFAKSLSDADFLEITSAPIGRRFSKTFGDVEMEIDLYSPKDFAGLDDRAHFENFQQALSEHEIVAYDGHSMLGASDFWSKPTYPDFYQIFLYGGCLGYEYYVRPILSGKGGWDNVDILSSVVEVTASANVFVAPYLAKLGWGLENGFRASWRDLLLAVRKSVGDSTFGVSGVRENKFCPDGVNCK